MAWEDSNTPNPTSQYEYPSAYKRLAGLRSTPHRYDKETACPHACTKNPSRRTSFQAPSTSKRTHLPQCCELDDSGRRRSNFYHQTPSQQSIVGRAIYPTIPKSYNTLTTLRHPTRLARLEIPATVDYPTLDKNERLIRGLPPWPQQRYCFLPEYYSICTNT